MLDSDVYQANDGEAPALTDSLLQKFVQVLTCTDRAHVSDKDCFLLFAPDALEYFSVHFDQRVLQQKLSHLQNPKKFSHAGKFKSLPWRLAILQHTWRHACSYLEDPDALWSRRLSQTGVQVFNFCLITYPCAQFLSPGSDFPQLLIQNNLQQQAAHKFPRLVARVIQRNKPLRCVRSVFVRLTTINLKCVLPVSLLACAQ